MLRGISLPEKLQRTRENGKLSGINVVDLAVNIQTHAFGVELDFLAALVRGEGEIIDLTHQK